MIGGSDVTEPVLHNQGELWTTVMNKKERRDSTGSPPKCKQSNFHKHRNNSGQMRQNSNDSGYVISKLLHQLVSFLVLYSPHIAVYSIHCVYFDILRFFKRLCLAFFGCFCLWGFGFDSPGKCKRVTWGVFALWWNILSWYSSVNNPKTLLKWDTRIVSCTVKRLFMWLEMYRGWGGGRSFVLLDLTSQLSSGALLLLKPSLIII